MTMFLAFALATAAALPPMPQDLDSVPVIDKWIGRKVSPRWSEDVAELYRRNNCKGAVPYEGSWLREIDILFLLDGEGKLLQLAPVNVHCPAVEKLVSARIMQSFKNSFPKTGMTDPHWMRSQVRFLWSDAP